jgi:hypothetical protein
MTLPSVLVVPGAWHKPDRYTCSVKPTTRSSLRLRRQWQAGAMTLAEVIRSHPKPLESLSRNERRTGERCFWHGSTE